MHCITHITQIIIKIKLTKELETTSPIFIIIIIIIIIIPLLL
jgi:hypothetical protein